MFLNVFLFKLIPFIDFTENLSWIAKDKLCQYFRVCNNKNIITEQFSTVLENSFIITLQLALILNTSIDGQVI